MNSKQYTAHRRCFALVLLVTLLLAALPAPALAGAPHRHPRPAPRASVPFALAGTVVQVTWPDAGETKGGETTGESGVDAAQLLLELERPERAQRGLSRTLALTVDEDAILLAADLSRLDLAALAVGDAVLVAPKQSWGVLAVQLLYAGTAEDLAAHSFRGRLLSSEGDTLHLQEGWGDDSRTVVVDEETHWLEHGLQPRPADLPQGLPLRVLGIEQEDGSVRAVVIAAGHAGL